MRPAEARRRTSWTHVVAGRAFALGLLLTETLGLVACVPTTPPPARSDRDGSSSSGAESNRASGTAPDGTAGVSATSAPPAEDPSLPELPPLAELPHRCDASEGDATTAPSLARLRGQVSYYADALHGRRTASGEPYDKHELTAASRTLPFGSLVRIRRRDMPERAVIVRVNDRGPFGRSGRVLDLSRAAAECLDMIRRGVVEVDAEVIRRGPG